MRLFLWLLAGLPAVWGLCCELADRHLLLKLGTRKTETLLANEKLDADRANKQTSEHRRLFR